MIFALLDRLQRDEHRAAVARAAETAAAGEADDGLDRGILPHDLDEVVELLLHRLERNALVAAHEADQAPGVLLREEALGHDDVEIDVEADRDGEQEHHQRRVAQRPRERLLVAAQHAIEDALRAAVEAPAFALGPVSQQERAHHRRRRERDDQRHEDRDRQHDRKLAEEPSDDAAHEQDRE